MCEDLMIWKDDNRSLILLAAIYIYSYCIKIFDNTVRCSANILKMLFIIHTIEMYIFPLK